MAGNNDTIGGGGFHHIALYVRDFETSMDFYTKVLGFTTKLAWGEAPKQAALLDTGDGNYFELIGSERKDDMPTRQTVHIALRSDDVDTAIERVRQAGAKITLEPKDITFDSDPPLSARIGFCEGPDGEAIEFFQNDLT
jgi:glyoxylase I family protein